MLTEQTERVRSKRILYLLLAPCCLPLTFRCVIASNHREHCNLSFLLLLAPYYLLLTCLIDCRVAVLLATTAKKKDCPPFCSPLFILATHNVCKDI